jgi:hypothetical protein
MLEHELELFSRNLESIKNESKGYFTNTKLLEKENIGLSRENVSKYLLIILFLG